MKQVGVFGSTGEALIARSFLRSHGIAADLPDEHTLRLSGGFDVALGWFRLLVPDDQAFQAEALLREVGGAAPDRPVCGRCGSSELPPIRSWPVPAFRRILDALLPFGPPSGRVRCARCEHVQLAEQGEPA